MEFTKEMNHRKLREKLLCQKCCSMTSLKSLQLDKVI